MKNENKQYESCLSKVPIFKNLTDEEKARIVDLIKVEKVKKGDFIYSAGDREHALYVVHQGKVKLSRVNKEGNEQVIRVLNPGDFMGERALFSNEAAQDYATSMEDCHLCVISAKALKEHMLKYPTTMFSVMQELSGRLEKAEAVIESTNLLPVDERIALSLLNLSSKFNMVKLPYSKGDWASLLGMKRETLSRKLRYFKENGYINLKGQRIIYILDRAYFEKLANL